MSWREHAADVDESYRRWSSAPRCDEPLRFAAYIAALDREETSAGAYQRSLDDLERWLPGLSAWPGDSNGVT